MEITGASAIVTGGASGLGAATVRKLAESNMRVVLVDINDELGDAVASEVGGAYVRADVTAEDELAAAIDAALEMAPLRVLVNCAGIGPPQRTVNRDGAPHDLAHFQKVIDINLVGTFNATRLAAAAIGRTEPLADNERGAIVNTASVAAFDGQIGQAAYSASKAGVAGMALPLAREFARIGVRVMTIAPGIFLTPMMEGMPEHVQQSLAEQVPFPSRLGRPQEFADLVACICESPMLNAETIRLDGAIRMQPK